MKKLNKSTIIKPIIGLLLIFLFGCTTIAQETPYKFGAVLPLTGNHAFYGEYAKAGIELAIEDLNKGINGRQIKIIYEDTVSDKAKAVTATQKLIQINDVDALFTVGTPHAAVMTSLAEEYRIPFIYGSSTTSLAEGKKYTFNDFPQMEQACFTLMEQAISKNKHVALFGTNAEFTQLCKKGAERKGVLDIFETYTMGETDFRTQFMKIKQSNADALILIAFANDCNLAFKQLIEIGVNVTLYSPLPSFACGISEHLSTYPEIFAGAVGADVKIDETNPAFVAFKQRLEERGWTTQIQGSAITYDSIMEMASAFKGCTNTECVLNNLNNLKAYPGITGTIDYNGGQVSNRELMLVTFNNGTWVKR